MMRNTRLLSLAQGLRPLTLPNGNGWRWGGGVVACATVGALLVGTNGSGRAANVQNAPTKTTLSGVPIDGKGQEEVTKLATELRARLLALPLTIRYGTHSEKTTAAKLGATCDVEPAVSAVFSPKSEGLVDSIKDRFSGPAARDIPLPVHFEAGAVSKALMRFAIRVGAEPHEPRKTKVDGYFKILALRPGRELDPDALAASLEKTFDGKQLRAAVADSLNGEPNRTQWLAGQKTIEIPAPTREAKGRITDEQLASITSTLASFSTGLGGSSRNRVGNIRIACKAIDGTVLLPGETFSYNDVVGPRVPGAGYKEAPVIINGELSKGIAGGICQVSSTLYNAALMADMRIVTRRHHAFPVHYLPAGRDATVVDGAIDFKFRNAFEHPVAIDAKVVGNRVVFNFYGSPEDKRQVEIQSTGVTRTPATSRTVNDGKLAKGRRVVDKPAKSGKRVTISRVVKKDGEVLRKEVVSRDYYPAQSGVIRVGTREDAKKPDTATPAGDKAPDAAPKSGSTRTSPGKPAASAAGTG